MSLRIYLFIKIKRYTKNYIKGIAKVLQKCILFSEVKIMEYMITITYKDGRVARDYARSLDQAKNLVEYWAEDKKPINIAIWKLEENINYEKRR